MIRIYIYLNYLRLLPCWLAIKNSAACPLIMEDFDRWNLILNQGKKPGTLFSFVKIMLFHPAFRNLVYSRLRNHSKVRAALLNILAGKQPLLDIDTQNMGGGTFIQHGYATIIAVRKMGRNCWVNQNVTLGYSNATDAPSVGDDVSIGAGATVIGAVNVGDHVIIGANAVVVKDIPSNCTVVGNPARIVKQNGVKVNISL